MRSSSILSWQVAAKLTVAVVFPLFIASATLSRGHLAVGCVPSLNLKYKNVSFGCYLLKIHFKSDLLSLIQLNHWNIPHCRQIIVRY